MPDTTADRTEAPTPRRRQEARARGQVARSAELASATLWLTGLLGLTLLGPYLWGDWRRILEASLDSDVTSPVGTVVFAGHAAVQVFLRLAPFLAALVTVSAVVLYSQVGWLVTTHPLRPDLSRLNPLKGVQRLFSSRNGVAALLNIGKLFLVAATAYLTFKNHVAEIVYSLTADYRVIFGMAVSLIFRLGLNLGLLLLLLAVIDYVYQRYRHEKDLRMTKQEVREELRTMEGDPMIKRRRRDVHRQLAFHRLKKEVPKADVVVTNPTHLAIALRYDPQAMIAPKVLAKGADLLAHRIRQIARASGIPIIERPSLVRLMYDHVDIGQVIPERFYQAIAEILAYVYEISGKSADSLRAAEA